MASIVNMDIESSYFPSKNDDRMQESGMSSIVPSLETDSRKVHSFDISAMEPSHSVFI